MMSQLDPAELVGKTLSEGRYELRELLGGGSMAHVYKAIDGRLNTDVVIKVPIRRYLEDQNFLTRFRQESQLLVALSHPHIVKIIDCDEIEHIPFVVMQFLGGGDLQDRLRKSSKGMAVDSLSDWLLDVAKALDFMHQKNIVHRDVKPGNLLFDDYGNVYLGDFGLTKVLAETAENSHDPGLTSAGAIVGTPNYVAPEIVMGLRCDGRSDQYSLATSVYEVLTGRPPLIGPTSSATMVNQTKKVPRALAEVNPEVSNELANAVHRGLAKSPRDRFATCVEFAEAVLFARSTTRSTGSVRSKSGHQIKTRSASGSRGSSPSVRKMAVESSKHSGNQRDHGASKSGVTSRRPQKLVSKGKPGLVPCPKCKKELPLRPEHKGRRGRCIHCRTLLMVGKELNSLKYIEEVQHSTAVRSRPQLQMEGAGGLPPKISRKKSDSTSANNSEELLLGEEVFGMWMSKRTITVLGAVLILVCLGATALIANFATEKEEDRTNIPISKEEG
ncbi:serine/threonine protein kinase [Thalassoroseus pseudoceratinae]|uniref:serine/threonine protein kinase n=1 Tax=Thalassoroseus pseudoceratinae TaxID=2713176 RepID=UPI00141E2E28|nr:serine/threonine-protein kinase [Thalassoroseus pseudoceratinae]